MNIKYFEIFTFLLSVYGKLAINVMYSAKISLLVQRATADLSSLRHLLHGLNLGNSGVKTTERNCRLFQCHLFTNFHLFVTINNTGTWAVDGSCMCCLFYAQHNFTTMRGTRDASCNAGFNS